MLKRNLPLAFTILVFIAGYLYCLSQYPGFASTRVVGDLLTDNAFLGIVAVGMTFVILSGGIDLSVGSTIAFTGVLLAKMIGEYGHSPRIGFHYCAGAGCTVWRPDRLDYRCSAATGVYHHPSQYVFPARHEFYFVAGVGPYRSSVV